MGGEERAAGPDGRWAEPAGLAERAQRAFDLLPIVKVSRIPGGWAARSYRLDDVTGRSYVLKVYDQTPDARMWLAAMTERLPILHALHHSGRFRRLPVPIPAASGAFTVPFDGCDLLLSTYIPGDHPPEDSTSWPDSLVQQLAERIADLHSLDAADLFEGLPREQFRLAFRSGLERGLERLEAANSSDRPGVLALRDLLWPRRQELLDLISRTEQLAKLARRHHPALVPCHADVHRRNLIVAQDGALHLLDWEGLRMAPAEQDLFFWADDLIGPAVLRHYLAARPDADLDPDTFAYYSHHRNLEDLADWVDRILDLDRGWETDQRDVQAISEYCLRWWGDLEAAAVRVARILEQIARA